MICEVKVPSKWSESSYQSISRKTGNPSHTTQIAKSANHFHVLSKHGILY